MAAAIPELKTVLVGAGPAERGDSARACRAARLKRAVWDPAGQFSRMRMLLVGGGMCRDEKLAQLKPHVGPTRSPLELAPFSLSRSLSVAPVDPRLLLNAKC